MLHVISVEPRENYNLLVTFDTGETKLCDFSPLLNQPVFEPLKNKAFFNTVKVGFGTAVWGEDIDIAPEYLYENGVKI